MQAVIVLALTALVWLVPISNRAQGSRVKESYRRSADLLRKYDGAGCLEANSSPRRLTVCFQSAKSAVVSS
jgi:hypothetical protein